MLDTDPDDGPGGRPHHLEMYLGLPNYTNNWKRIGFTDDDLADGGSDRLVDALVAWGDEDAIVARVQAHRDAGADHVCIQALEQDPRQMPAGQWRALRAGRSSDAVTSYDFDRYLRYEELVGWLDALAAAHPELVIVETYGRSYEGRDLKLVTVTDASHRAPTTRKPAHWVDAIDPRRGADRHRRRLLAAAAPRRRPGRRRPRRHRGAADAHVLRRAARQPRRRRVGARRSATVPPLQCAAVAVARRPPLAGCPRRGHRRRRPRPADAHPRPGRGVDAAPRRRPPHDPRPARRHAGRHAPVTGCSTRARSSTSTASRSRRPGHPRAST